MLWAAVLCTELQAVRFFSVWAAESDSGKNGDNTTITSQKTVCPGGVLLYFKLYAPNLRNIIFIAIFALRRRGEKKEKTVERSEEIG